MTEPTRAGCSARAGRAAIASACLVACLTLGACLTPEQAAERNARRPPTPAEVEQHNAMVPPEERIVCRNEIPVTSNIPVRKCRLMADIDETSLFHREQLRRALR
ncbi:MAG: hypothetical protein Q8K97_07435 [Pseudohongiella sp.]|nr:hypothetical protein [Pseudohongiella sp.]